LLGCKKPLSPIPIEAIEADHCGLGDELLNVTQSFQHAWSGSDKNGICLLVLPFVLLVIVASAIFPRCTALKGANSAPAIAGQNLKSKF
jgi:hypothetical protein